ncbi:MAG: Rrf2 family transcriptional regulator [Phycisphaeraceae bacterium]|nr:Rrf2 family transcriptional regulator [Phycisphaeraceae bacterium]
MLSQAVGYAIQALGYIASAGGKPVLVKEVAEAAEIPPAYLAKIIHALAKQGLVVTQRGIGGGVTLARPATDISMLDLCAALADPITVPRCMLGSTECSDQRCCPAHTFWVAHRTRMLDFLRGTCVADIAAFEARRRWKAAAAEIGIIPHDPTRDPMTPPSGALP